MGLTTSRTSIRLPIDPIPELMHRKRSSMAAASGRQSKKLLICAKVEFGSEMLSPNLSAHSSPRPQMRLMAESSCFPLRRVRC